MALLTTVPEEDLSNLDLSVLAVRSPVLFVELSDYSLSYCEVGLVPAGFAVRAKLFILFVLQKYDKEPPCIS